MGPVRHSARRRGAHAPRGAHPTRVRLSEGAPLLQAPRAGCPCSQCRGCAWSEAPAASTGGGGRARLDLCTRESRTPGRQRLRETEAPGVGLAPTRGPRARGMHPMGGRVPRLLSEWSAERKFFEFSRHMPPARRGGVEGAALPARDAGGAGAEVRRRGGKRTTPHADDSRRRAMGAGVTRLDHASTPAAGDRPGRTGRRHACGRASDGSSGRRKAANQRGQRVRAAGRAAGLALVRAASEFVRL